MFTGLIQKIGKVRRISCSSGGLVLEIAFATPWGRDLEDGESVAVNGGCLTVVKHDKTRFTADVLRETIEKTGLDTLVPGTEVNLERALRTGDSLGGHIVQGHVQTRGIIAEKRLKGRDFAFKIKAGRVAAAECVLKGSIAIDGVSLTISGLGDDWIQVDVIPATAENTTLGKKRIGDKVNIETDILTRSHGSAETPEKPKTGGITLEMLAENGFI